MDNQCRYRCLMIPGGAHCIGSTQGSATAQKGSVEWGKPRDPAQPTTPHRARAKAAVGAECEFHAKAAKLLRELIAGKRVHRLAILAGLEAARHSAPRPRRPIGRPRASPETDRKVKRLLRQGMGTKAIVVATGVGVGKVIAMKKELGIPLGRPRRRG